MFCFKKIVRYAVYSVLQSTVINIILKRKVGHHYLATEARDGEIEHKPEVREI